MNEIRIVRKGLNMKRTNIGLVKDNWIDALCKELYVNEAVNSGKKQVEAV